ncbi:stage III sporulation protein AE [Laceyella sacchari]|jgi:stage III sporulation protein AE|uniref:Stage III sporulation protein AE n=1 Tax=Laceyella tengchongensis TaxID=574699 RepID=A0AA45WR56_9BACL|nr:stage III sporulation protein AE [Laceyella tengchongensis]AUS08529.1 stage III sporulation protein AE [Laceyella sacchari]MRG28198.1 stage III sporulation protein AE [Laceyella tengchongensis]SMP28811.1 stage III sporulation protein AE [Laceyella tengchongensis]
MKRIAWIFPFLCLFLLLIRPSVFAAEEESGSSVIDQLVRSQLNQTQVEQVDTFWKQLKGDYGEYLGGEQGLSLFDLLLSPNKELSLEQVLMGFVRFFFHEILYNGKLLGTIVVLTVLSMLLRTLQTAFEQNQVSKVAYAIVFMVLIILAANSFHVAVDSAKTAIGRMIDFMLALVPMMLTLLVSMGNIGSVALFHPLIVFMIHMIGTFIYTIVFPLLFLSAILSIVSCLSEKYKVNQLASLLRKISVSVLGGLLAIFLGVISIQGATASIADGVTLRTAKYITGNFIPVIGRTISEAADTVMGASLLVKNTIGLAGVLILLFICAFPALKILSLAFIYNFTAAVMQPLGNSPIIESLSTIGRTLIYIFAALATVGLMFFLAITIIVASGNVSVMMR